MSARAVTWAGLALAFAGGVGAVARAIVPRAPPGTGRIAAVIAHVDLDGDGALSRAEYDAVAPAQMPFDAYDLDHDGLLCAREVLEMTLATDPLWLVRMPDLDPPRQAPALPR